MGAHSQRHEFMMRAWWLGTVALSEGVLLLCLLSSASCTVPLPEMHVQMPFDLPAGTCHVGLLLQCC